MSKMSQFYADTLEKDAKERRDFHSYLASLPTAPNGGVEINPNHWFDCYDCFTKVTRPHDCPEKIVLDPNRKPEEIPF